MIFDLETIIKNHVNKEANKEWAKNFQSSPVPKYQESKIEKCKPGWVNFFKNIIIDKSKELFP